MERLLFEWNAKIVLWLNKNYINHSGSSTTWFIKPNVFVMVGLRLLFIGFKLLLSFLRRIVNTKPKVHTGDSTLKTLENLENKINRSFIEIILFRNIKTKQDSYICNNIHIYPTPNPNEYKELAKMIKFETVEKPNVSIIIPVYGKIEYTINCLRSLQISLKSEQETEIIIIDDHSKDETAEILEQITGIVYYKNDKNIGFVNSCNKGAALSKGEYLYFLNNDTQVLPNFLEELLKVFQKHVDCGAVGSKLIYPDGSLQEAGGLVFKDGTTINHGNKENSEHPYYNYLKEVDYCSGASLMIKRTAFFEIGGFDTHFAPAYYEDVDLCFSVKYKQGQKVYYQPESQVVHFEGISSGREIVGNSVKKYQLINLEKFRLKWKTELKNHHNYSFLDKREASLKYSSKTILVIDSYMPRFDKESGSNRLMHILRILKSLNYHVIFIPDDWAKEQPYCKLIQQEGIEAWYGLKGLDLIQLLRNDLKNIGVAWTCRPEITEIYLPLIRKLNQKTKIIYDTIDIHFLRLQREEKLNLHSSAFNWKEVRDKEMALTKKADKVIAITVVDREILLKNGAEEKKLIVIPNIHIFKGSESSYLEREGLLFIGSYNHPPNTDAALWLCIEIMPILWQTIPNMKLYIIGQNPPPELLALSSDKIKILGYVPDVKPYFDSSRIFVAPLRYGAGMKGKIGQSLEFALPIVTTSIGSEGMDLVPNQDILVAEEKFEFAQSVITLYNDQVLWERLHNNSEAAIQKFSPKSVEKNLKTILEGC